MDILKMLEDKVTMIKSLIESKRLVLDKTEKPEEIKKLTDEILTDTENLGRARIELEYEQKRQKLELEEAAKKSAQTNGGIRNPDPASVNIIAQPGKYKSPFAPGNDFNLKKEIALVKRSNVSPAILKSFENNDAAEEVCRVFIDLIAKGYSMATSPMALAAAQKTAMAEGAEATGKVLRMDDVRTELISYIRDQSIALQDCTLVQMNSDIQTWPKELTSVSVGYGAETEEASESDPTFEDVTLTARKMHAYSVCSNELIQDTFINGGIVAVLLPQFVEAVGQKVDSTVFIADGTDSALFSGVFTAAAGYSQVFGTSSAAFSMLLESDLRGIIAQIPERYISANGKWYLHQTTLWNNVRGLKDSNGMPLYGVVNTGGAFPEQLLGYPIRKPSAVPSTSAASTAMMILANLKGVYIGERMTNIDLFVDPYYLATKGQTRFILWTRWGYAIALKNMIGRIVTAA